MFRGPYEMVLQATKSTLSTLCQSLHEWNPWKINRKLFFCNKVCFILSIKFNDLLRAEQNIIHIHFHSDYACAYNQKYLFFVAQEADEFTYFPHLISFHHQILSSIFLLPLKVLQKNLVFIFSNIIHLWNISEK